jgi:nitrous oxidase accessory protein NosD
MNSLVREKLREIIDKHGRSLAESPKRCEALLRDYCGQYKREINVLVRALEQRVAADLMNSSKATPAIVLRARLSRRLQDELGLSEESSTWAVDSWALALGVASAQEMAEGAGNQSASRRPDTPAARKTGHSVDPEDPFIQGSPAAPLPSQPEEILRQALRIVLADNHATEYEKADLQAIRQRLVITVDAASRIFAEVKKERQQPTQKTQVASSPVAALVVSQEPGAKYTSINQALRSAPPGARINVRPGLYRESVVIDKPVHIMGDGPVEQVVVESMDSPCLVIRAGEGEIRGLSLRGDFNESDGGHPAIDIGYGQVLLEDCDVTSNSSVCISIHGRGVAPVIRRCRVHDGGNYGIWVWDNAAGLIEESEIFGNSGAGVVLTGDTLEEARQMAAYILSDLSYSPADVDEILGMNSGNAQPGGNAGGRPLVRRCSIHGGRDHGVWVHYKGQGVVEHCLISENFMAGVCVDQGSDSAIRHCRIIRNGWEAIRITNSSSAIVEDCDLSENGDGAWAVEQGCLVRQSGNKE